MQEQWSTSLDQESSHLGCVDRSNLAENTQAKQEFAGCEHVETEEFGDKGGRVEQSVHIFACGVAGETKERTLLIIHSIIQSIVQSFNRSISHTELKEK